MFPSRMGVMAITGIKPVNRSLFRPLGKGSRDAVHWFHGQALSAEGFANNPATAAQTGPLTIWNTRSPGAQRLPVLPRAA